MKHDEAHNCPNFDLYIESNNVANNCRRNDWRDFTNNLRYSVGQSLR